MVNTGKPSSGCKLCKARRIKCDEVKPYCMKCKKVGRQCPGYTNPFEARIKDQTQATIKRFKKMRGEEDPQSREDALAQEEEGSPSSIELRRPRRYIPAVTMALSRSPSTSDEDFDEEDDMLGLSPGVTLSIEDRASCYFASQFILTPQRANATSPKLGRWFPFLPTFLGKSEVPECLTNAFKAASIVALASHQKMRHGTSLMWAQRHYLKAVRAVNEAIQNPERVKKDETLAAILLLAFYESLSSDSISAYVNHMKGAAMLIEVRGEEGLTTPESLSMFDMTRNSVFAVYCMPSGPELPQCRYLMRHLACKNSGLAEMNLAGSQIRHAIDRIFRSCRTKEDYAERNPARVQKVLEVLQRARALQARFTALHDTMSPPGWAPEVVDTVPPRRDAELDTCPSFTGPVYHFDQLGVAAIHLTTWTSHLMLTTSIMRLKAWLAYPEDYRTRAGKDGAEFDEVARSAALRVADLVALVPYYCRFGETRSGASGFACGEELDQTRGAPCQMLLWPLFAASGSDFASASERRFLRGRLRFFAEEVGLRQARVFLQKNVTSPTSDIEKDQGKGYGW